MSEVDDYREQLTMLALKVEKTLRYAAYAAADQDEQLDWLDLGRIALEIVTTVHRAIQQEAEEALARERTWARREMAS
jgi:hypothetical protein